MQRDKRINFLLITGLVVLVIISLIAFFAQRKSQTDSVSFGELVRSLKGDAAWDENKPDIIVDLLTPNEYSRPQVALEDITGIVIHYTANPGSSAADNRSYFEGLKDSGLTSASSHFIVGLGGEVIQCIPTSEISYASNGRNKDTVSIEVCHSDETGKFSSITYNSLVELTGWLCGYLGVEPEDVIRHYDVTGKPCPLYYVEHENEWFELIADVKQWIMSHIPVKE